VKVDKVVVTIDVDVWEEPNLTASGSGLFASHERGESPEGQEPRRGVSVAVAVSETAPSAGLPAGHPPTEKPVPRLVVFGDGSWLANDWISRQASGADVFAGCLSWLRGKAILGKSDIEDKERNLWTL